MSNLIDTYYDSADSIMINEARVRREFAAHGVDFPETMHDFKLEHGDGPEWDAQAVLRFLGY